MARRNPSVAFGASVNIPQGMTSVHFAYIAEIVKGMSGDMPRSVRRDWARDIAIDLRQSNPAFDPTRFYAACGVE